MSNAKRLNKRDDEDVTGSLAWEVTSPVELAQLDAEIVSEMNWRKPAGLLVEGLADEASDENPITIWVTHEGGKVSVISRVIKDHEPDPSWRPEGEDADRMTANELLTRIESGSTLTHDEIVTALRLLLAAASEDTE